MSFSPNPHLRTAKGRADGPPPQRLSFAAADQPSRRKRAISAVIASKRRLTRPMHRL